MNPIPNENYQTTPDDWLSQYGGQREMMMARCQCTSCYLAKPQASHRKCGTIYPSQDDYTTYPPATYTWTQLGG